MILLLYASSKEEPFVKLLDNHFDINLIHLKFFIKICHNKFDRPKTLPSIGTMPSGDESFTTTDTSFSHFKQSNDKFSITLIQLFFRLRVLQV